MKKKYDKNINTLIPDIHRRLTVESHDVNEQALDQLLTDIKETCITYLQNPQQLYRDNAIRVSKLGTRDRKLWFDYHTEPPEAPKELTPSEADNIMRFFIGSFMEAVMIYLAREAGHTVEYEQHTVDIDGISGHLDCLIDGELVDIKTASPYSFSKFSEGKIFQEDTYGYITQLSSYHHGFDGQQLPNRAYFWAFDKSFGTMCLLEIDDMDMINVPDRVERVNEIVAMDSPPEEKCWPEQEHNKSGNMKLHKNCTYCPHKIKCWDDANSGVGLRAFKYANELVYMTHVVKEPTVEEILI